MADKSDANRGPQVGPSRNANDPTKIASAGDKADTYSVKSDRHFSNILTESLRQPNQSVSSTSKKGAR